MAGLNLRNVSKSFGNVHVIHGVDLDIDDGEFVVFVGPSGCGKSTLLRLIAGLEDATGGNIAIGEQDVTEVEPADRGVAMVFQSYALYPHMSVEENMGFGLKMTGTDRAVISQRVGKASKILHLDELLQRKPKQLSGG
ncbi:MAG: ABC transporter ATP-binding protein, partial [Rhizobiaceae bacterium]